MHFMLPQCLLSDWSAERVRIPGFQTHKESYHLPCVCLGETHGVSPGLPSTSANVGQRQAVVTGTWGSVFDF